MRPLDRTDLTGEVVATTSGDIIAFDEHLEHSSPGRATGKPPRHQWRVDFLADPVGAQEEAEARQYFASIFVPEWDGGYDVRKFPSYDGPWQASERPGVDRLRGLGAYALAEREESGLS